MSAPMGITTQAPLTYYEYTKSRLPNTSGARTHDEDVMVVTLDRAISTSGYIHLERRAFRDSEKQHFVYDYALFRRCWTYRLARLQPGGQRLQGSPGQRTYKLSTEGISATCYLELIWPGSRFGRPAPKLKSLLDTVAKGVSRKCCPNVGYTKIVTNSGAHRTVTCNNSASLRRAGLRYRNYSLFSCPPPLPFALAIAVVPFISQNPGHAHHVMNEDAHTCYPLWCSIGGRVGTIGKQPHAKLPTLLLESPPATYGDYAGQQGYTLLRNQLGNTVKRFLLTALPILVSMERPASSVLLRPLVALKGIHNPFGGTTKKCHYMVEGLQNQLGVIQMVLSRRPTLAAPSLLPPITVLHGARRKRPSSL
ncbi:hypothetical protein BDN71DRAFT_1434516 [Pleurotus eryngii]|uniref:Uncharacterized protein n=1 Tax=Pleurotus eryngii TaxID=5323 RepID=A0A9P5ZP89_PLEER|nr:hypothetical protein BDN71DRAFT_1434516 [Pleurotus eryngii]